MRLGYAFFAKQADLMHDRTVAALGACFERVNATNFPIPFVTLSIVINVLFDAEERAPNREYTLRVRIDDPNGNRLNLPPDALAVKFEYPAAKNFRSLTAVLTVNNLTFPLPGDYRFVFHVDDLEIGSTLLAVLEAK